MNANRFRTIDLRIPSLLSALLVLFGIMAFVALGCGASAAEDADEGQVTQATEAIQTEDASLVALNHEDDGHDDAVEAAHEDGDGHDDAVAVHDEGDGHDEDGDVLEVTLHAVEGRQWGFDPDVIEVPVGQRVKLTLVNDGGAEHDVEVEGLLADHIELEGGMGHSAHPGEEGHLADVVAAHAMSGTSASVMFTPTKAGEYEFACTLPGHKQAGMIGRLIVTN